MPDMIEKLDGRQLATKERIRLKAEAKKTRRETFRGEDETS